MLVLIYILVVGWFKSFSIPLVIMIPIPLTLVGILPGLFAFDFLAGLGGWGRLIGFVVGLLYFGVYNSAIGNGQTLGKRLMNIRVVDVSGKTIGILRSLVRYALLGTPFFLNGAMLPSNIQLSWLGYLIGMVVFGLGGAIVYLAVFNRRTRQSVHDLAVGTFVVCVAGESVPRKSVWHRHYAVLGVMGLAAVVAMMFVPKLTQLGPFPRLLELQQAIQNTGLVHTNSVMVGKNGSSSGGTQKETSYLQVQLVMRERPKDNKTTAKEIGRVILQTYPEVRARDAISISIVYGYDIGIASSWIRENFNTSPSDLDAALLNKN